MVKIVRVYFFVLFLVVSLGKNNIVFNNIKVYNFIICFVILKFKLVI